MHTLIAVVITLAISQLKLRSASCSLAGQFELVIAPDPFFTSGSEQLGALTVATGSQRCPQCPLVALSRHLKNAIDLAIGVKRTCLIAAHMSACDPKRTFADAPPSLQMGVLTRYDATS
jgi:hypothetical protein